MLDVSEAKRAMRAQAAAARQAAHAARGAAAAAALRDLFLAKIPIQSGAVVSGFWPMGPEIDVRPLLAALNARGHVLGLPVVIARQQPLVFRRWQPGDAVVAAGFGTSVPPPDAPRVTPTLLIVPLLAFDAEGYRLGYGGGFYDRTLAELRAAGAPLAVGVAYAEQEVPRVPRTPSDQPLDWAVTDAAARRFG